jgi:hypothetical protein
VPRLESDADIAPSLTWCEDRINAINESMMFDNTNKPAVGAGGGPVVTDTSLSLPERQTQLAVLVQGMVPHTRSQAQAAARVGVS